MNGEKTGVLHGMRIVEGSAFVAAPLGGMTLAQMGADVIRFDNIGGGIDFHRWPVTPAGTSLFWAGMNKGKRSLAVDVRRPEGQEIITALICGGGADAGIFLSNFPATGWLSDERLWAQRTDLIYVNITDDDGRPLTREGVGDRSPDTLRRSGDDGRLAV